MHVLCHGIYVYVYVRERDGVNKKGEVAGWDVCVKHFKLIIWGKHTTDVSISCLPEPMTKHVFRRR